jgi:TPR repeat protein
MAQAHKTPSRKVYDLLLKADAAGDVRSTYALATWHLFGSPFTKVNLRRATAMLKRAAEGGSADAAYDLAVSYEKGAGVRKSDARAFELYVQAALMGDVQSHYEVGRMYFWGIGTPRNRTLAEAWFKRAKSLGMED